MSLLKYGKIRLIVSVFDTPNLSFWQQSAIYHHPPPTPAINTVRS